MKERETGGEEPLGGILVGLLPLKYPTEEMLLPFKLPTEEMLPPSSIPQKRC